MSLGKELELVPTDDELLADAVNKRLMKGGRHEIARTVFRNGNKYALTYSWLSRWLWRLSKGAGFVSIAPLVLLLSNLHSATSSYYYAYEIWPSIVWYFQCLCITGATTLVSGGASSILDSLSTDAGKKLVADEERKRLASCGDIAKISAATIKERTEEYLSGRRKIFGKLLTQTRNDLATNELASQKLTSLKLSRRETTKQQRQLARRRAELNKTIKKIEAAITEIDGHDETIKSGCDKLEIVGETLDIALRREQSLTIVESASQEVREVIESIRGDIGQIEGDTEVKTQVLIEGSELRLLTEAKTEIDALIDDLPETEDLPEEEPEPEES